MFNILQKDSLYITIGLIILILAITIIHRVRKALRENEKLKYEFISIIAHKFRTPLTYIKWAASELQSKEQDSYKLDAIKDINVSNEKLIKLTGTLVELADPDNVSSSTYNLEKTSLCDFVKMIGDNQKSSFHEKNLFFSVQCDQEEIMVNIDRARMEFVIETILENAQTYSTPGKNVEVFVGSKGSKAVITVVDHGIGIDPSDMPRIFGRFFRAENARRTDTEGFGIGLHLAQMIVRRHKGKIELFSEGKDKGTTCVITLKRAR